MEKLDRAIVFGYSSRKIPEKSKPENEKGFFLRHKLRRKKNNKEKVDNRYDVLPLAKSGQKYTL